MANLPSLPPREICRLLESKGFELNRIKGSHRFYKHPVSKKITSVPMHKKDLPKGTLFAILKQAGINKEEL